MSKPITLSCPANWAVRAIPTMPPAGPLKMASLPANTWASVKPPEDCMNISFTPGISLATWST